MGGPYEPSLPTSEPHRRDRTRYAGALAAWTLSVLVRADGSIGCTVGKMDIASRSMTFTRLADRESLGSPDASAVEALVQAAIEVQVDRAEQLRLF